jgi:hypothetical protein
VQKQSTDGIRVFAEELLKFESGVERLTQLEQGFRMEENSIGGIRMRIAINAEFAFGVRPETLRAQLAAFLKMVRSSGSSLCRRRGLGMECRRGHGH